MKFAIISALMLLSFQVRAADTSGCSPLLSQAKSVITAKGMKLTVTAYKPNAPTCWNAKEAAITVNYEWLQKNASQNSHVVNFYVRLNNTAGTVSSVATCRQNSEFTTQANTAGTLYRCSATATLSIAGMSSVNVEVAPQADGIWDTASYGQNYGFSF
jgi:hypothetical protein